ncbi:MAG: CAP domain-containing protein [Chitinophagaceae bacterium]
MQKRKIPALSILSIHRTRFPLLIVAVSLLVFLPSFISMPADLDKDVLTWTNQFRRSNGMKELIMREDLNEIARKHSEDMAKGKTDFGHDGFEKRYSKVRKIFKSCTAAENVAYGATTGKDAVTQWKNSSPHRHNLLGDYRYIGIGTARDREGRIYYTQIFVG